MNNSIVGAMNLATSFRLFLRNYFYPKNSQLIANSLYSYIQGVDDLDYVSDTLTCKAKCKLKKITDSDINGENVETALIDMLRKGNIQTEIVSASIDDIDKSNFLSVYDQINTRFHFCGYLKALYNIVYIPLNSSTYMMEIYL